MGYIGKTPNTEKIELSDEVNLDKSDVGASSKAVKTVNDKVVATETKITQVNQKITEVQSSVTNIENNVETIINTAGGGAAVLEISEDKVLTADDPRNLLVTATTPGLSITLPSASSIEADGIAFRIAVDGDYDVTVKDAQGIPVGDDSGMIAVGKTRLFLLMDKATGKWHAAQYSGTETSNVGFVGNTIFSNNVSYIFNAARTTEAKACLVSQDKILVAYDGIYHETYASILTISGSNISIGEKKLIVEKLSLIHI